MIYAASLPLKQTLHRKY